MLDLVIAAPGGRAEVEALVADLTARRQQALMMATDAINDIGLQAIRLRAEVVRTLTSQRNALQIRIAEQLAPSLQHLENANDKVRKELAAVGLGTPAH